MRRLAALVPALWILLSVSAVAEEAAPPAAFANTLSSEPFAWMTRGFSLVLERRLTPRFSLAVGAGIRIGALGDYSGLTANLGLEARGWRKRLEGAVTGLYGGFRTDVGYTTLHDRDAGRAAGTSVSIDPTLTAGYRFVVFRRLELTPFGGLGVRLDIDPSARLGAWWRPTLTTGFTVGWMF